MIRRLALVVLTAALLFVASPWQAASAQPATEWSLPFMPSCKSAPVPDVPGEGLASFFDRAPAHVQPGDPFKAGSKTTMYDQYGLAGLRYDNYDLGCGPDAARDPGAVIGTSVANWLMQLPLAATALTASLTRFAFHPTFLDVFDPMLHHVSAALHDSLFATWLPVVLVVLGVALIVRARRAALATSAAAVGWALLVVILATALFRWPIQAGHIADQTVTGTLGSVVTKLDGHGAALDAGTAVASQVEDAILYRAWVAGTLGSADSSTAQKYGPQLFDAHALTWSQAKEIQRNPDAAQGIIQAKQDKWTSVADQIKQSDPSAYAYLTGHRSEARVGYAVLATVATLLALPFLLLSALLLLGCYMIVRLAVMMFPAFATLGAFPAARGLVIGLGRVVGAAVVNSIIFGVGAGVTIMVLGLLFAPGHGAPGWLGLVLMPLFTFLMWKALRPFRRLTEMVSPHRDHFADMAGLGSEARGTSRSLRRIGVTAAGVFTGNAATVAAAVAGDGDEKVAPRSQMPRAEGTSQPGPEIRALPAALSHDGAPSGGTPAPEAPVSGPVMTAPWSDGPGPERQTFRPQPSEQRVPPEPTEPEWVDGEEIYTIYRPSEELDDATLGGPDAA